MKNNAHTVLVAETLIALGKIRKFVVVWKNHTGLAYVIESVKEAIKTAIQTGNFVLTLKKLRPIAFGLKGSADILGILWNGKFIAFECKTGEGKQSKEQKAFEQMVLNMQGHYVLVRKKEEASDYVLKHFGVK